MDSNQKGFLPQQFEANNWFMHKTSYKQQEMRKI